MQSRRLPLAGGVVLLRFVAAGTAEAVPARSARRESASAIWVSRQSPEFWRAG